MIKKLLIIFTILISIPTITYAVIFDKERSNTNEFKALTLNTQLTPSNYPLNLSIDQPTNNSFSFILKNIGTTTTSNDIYIQDISDPIFANQINVEVLLNETTLLYNGPLNLLKISDYKDQLLEQTDKIGMIFSMTSENLTLFAQKSITFTVENHSWQESMAPYTGFFDSEHLDIEIKNNTPIYTPFNLESFLPDVNQIDLSQLLTENE